MLITENKVLLNRIVIDTKDGKEFKQEDYFIKFEKGFLATSELSSNILILKSLDNTYKSKTIVLDKYNNVNIQDISIVRFLINNIYHYQALLTFSVLEGNKTSHIVSLLDWNDNNSKSKYNIENLSITVQDPFEFSFKKTCLNEKDFYISNIERNLQSTKLGYIGSLSNEDIFTIDLFSKDIREGYVVSDIISCQMNEDSDLVLVIETYDEETEYIDNYVLVFQRVVEGYKLVYKRSELSGPIIEKDDDKDLEVYKEGNIGKVIVNGLDIYIYYTEYESDEYVKNNFIKLEKNVDNNTYIEKKLNLFKNDDENSDEENELIVYNTDDIATLSVLTNNLFFLYNESRFKFFVIKKINDDNFNIVNGVELDLKKDILNVNAVYNYYLNIIEVRYISS